MTSKHETQRRRGENVKLNRPCKYTNMGKFGETSAFSSPKTRLMRFAEHLICRLRHKLYERERLLGNLLNLTPCGSEVPQWRNWEKFLHIIHDRLDIVFIQLASENGDLVNDAAEK